ncbi:MAG: APC family permease [Bryobacteraceae bacterium]|nr:APC family permease [Bryobacteraceae bacterium]
MADRMSDPALDTLGYKPQFRRVLSRGDLVLYGLVILTPTAAYPVFGIVQQVSHGHAALSYLVALVAMLFTASSYGKMAGAFPSAGSTYTYAQRSLSEHIGFLAGWSMILDYVLSPLLSVVYISLTAARLLPVVPYFVWAAVFSIGITLVNVRGIRVTALVSKALLYIMATSTVLFVFLAARSVLLGQGAKALVQPRAVFDPQQFSLPALMLGAGIATLSYIGFDAVSTLAEDTRNPKRDIPFAMLVVCILQAVFCFLTVYLAAIAWPAGRPFQDVETASLDVSQYVGGTFLFGFITFVLLVAGLASSLTALAGASRLLFGMGRDGVLPQSVFGYIDPKHATPTRSIYLMGFIAFAGSLLSGFQLIVELLNFGAFVGFILVNLSVIRHYFFRLRRRRGMDFLTNLVFPLLGALVCTYVWVSLSHNAKLVGFAWLGVGVIYLAVLTGGFKRSPVSLQIE